MTYGKRQWEHLDTEMRRLIPVFHHEVAHLVKAIDDDTAAFNDYMVRRQPGSLRASISGKTQARPLSHLELGTSGELMMKIIACFRSGRSMVSL